MPTEPFVRWAGGKTWFVSHLPDIIGDLHIEHYHEPFLGGGAVFFAQDFHKKSYLSDANAQLINAYIQVKEVPEALIELLQNMPNTAEDYYRIRGELTDDSTLENAARFIFLNQTSFNGIYRVNRNGQYNVPYGFREHMVYDVERIRLASQKLQNTRISVGDFEINKYRIRENDLVFLDPPYTVSHNNNGFIAYNQKLFSIEDQERLKRFIGYIEHKGAYYILTNAAHNAIRDIFLTPGERMIELNRSSTIGGRNANRAVISEYIFTNIPEVHHE